ncbi:aminoglycoside phosphotransferase [Labrys okinawensis]|uniref:Aminoglycoside phosphotransferase n=1 Tax=Labrys okinawensis TaxID=346911 RepID=A0A2S9QJM9_9HYPH|nr:bifunctional aminoglycoside phosphotransferase/ATP-binding protein [Labrys okinawensis]PRH89554.1 aminoglycoside phosphotransferase [Labrys okinawensis]
MAVSTILKISPPAATHVVADQNEVIDFLLSPCTHGRTEPVQRIDTHGAIVFLAGDRVYKLKRAVQFPFMDLSTVDRRGRACEREVEVNSAYAPEIYLDAVPITRSGDGLQLRGEGAVVDWVVRMKRFDETGTLDRLADRDAIGDSLLADIVAAVLASHEKAPVRDGLEATRSLERYIRQNDRAFRESPSLFPPQEIEALTAAAKQAYRSCFDLLVERGKAGFVRRCHGDLHLRNIAVIDGRATLFDAIEFDESIATCDVLYDLAFLLMDLWDRGLHRHANRVLNRYLWEASEAHLAGLAALPLFLSIRAALRAKIAAAAAMVQAPSEAQASRADARRYFGLARRFLVEVPPRLVAIGGLSGTGKTTLALALAPFLGRAPGAVILRSDIERKRLAGIAQTQKLSSAAYSPSSSTAVYDTLSRKADIALDAGCSVVLDAVYANLPQRHVAEGIALRAGAGFTGFWLHAPLPVMERRVSSRRNDASDADVDVVRKQAGYDLGRISWHRLDATLPRKDIEDEALSCLALRCADGRSRNG